MRRSLLLALLGFALVPASASATPKYHECQHPVRTGVEVYRLHHIKAKAACPGALALFKWENATPKHARKLYGCHRPSPDAAGYPYLRKHHFHGYRLSLVGNSPKSYGFFTMSRGRKSFAVGGTDFPLNCT